MCNHNHSRIPKYFHHHRNSNTLTSLPNYPFPKTLMTTCSLVTKPCLTLWSYGLQHTWLPYPSPSPGACSSSCPLTRWCHLTILSSVAPFSSCFSLSQHPGQLITNLLIKSNNMWFPLSGFFQIEKHEKAVTIQVCLGIGNKTRLNPTNLEVFTWGIFLF